MEVRRAFVTDAEQIAAVHVRGWQAGYRGLLPQAYLDGLDAGARVPGWRRSLEQSVAVVAVSGGAVIGFAHVGPTRDDYDAADPVGEVTSIYVLPEVWGTGVGRALMRAATDALAAAGFATATLWVLDANARAIRFYERVGWAADGAVKRDRVAGVLVTELRFRRAL